METEHHQSEVAHLFEEKFPIAVYIQGTVSKIEKQFHERNDKRYFQRNELTM